MRASHTCMLKMNKSHHPSTSVDLFNHSNGLFVSATATQLWNGLRVTFLLGRRKYTPGNNGCLCYLTRSTRIGFLLLLFFESLMFPDWFFPSPGGFKNCSVCFYGWWETYHCSTMIINTWCAQNRWPRYVYRRQFWLSIHFIIYIYLFFFIIPQILNMYVYHFQKKFDFCFLNFSPFCFLI